MGKFITIGERIHCISPVIRAAMEAMNPEPILQRAREQIAAGAVYLDVNIGPAEKNRARPYALGGKASAGKLRQCAAVPGHRQQECN